ncbi:F-box only protein 30-like [Asterias amurensis]|uniref:F-box only protein 30-like n=1 Tax=Asterias amurensis TaxID=7602 RepID=UPI003AB6F7CB
MPSSGLDNHDHCQTCHNTRCNTRLTSCHMIQCELECGARFHSCKAVEHRMLCSNEKVQCINCGYGCPIEVQRSNMSQHLNVCPASLVHCTMEWNRWPVCSSERQSHQPVQVLMDFNKEQLDIALALRDQRMLTKSMRASIRTRQILTNSLNRRHPAVPLTNQHTNGSSEKEFDEEKELENLLQDMHQWENKTEQKRSRSPAGLRQSICDELYRASQDTVQQLSKALNVMTESSPVPELPDFSLGSSAYPYIHCKHCERRKERLDRLLDSREAMKEDSQSQQLSESNEPITDQNTAGHHLDDDDVHLTIIRETLARDLKSKDQTQELADHRHSSSSSEDSLTGLPLPVLFVIPSSTGEVSAAPLWGHSKIQVIEPPKTTSGSSVASSPATGSSSPKQASLSLDLSLESITRYQAKPDSMYTFLCAQVFRRDEFASHFENVHSDIHGGLNGWLEPRCPLAPYGCTFSQRRFYPGEKSARVVHNENLESFGVRLDGNRPIPMEEITLADGPIEMEWVGVTSNGKDKTIPTIVNGNSQDQNDNRGFSENTFKAITNSHLNMSERNGKLEMSSSNVELRNSDQVDQSDGSLLEANQSGSSSCKDAMQTVQLCATKQNGGFEADTKDQINAVPNSSTTHCSGQDKSNVNNTSSNQKVNADSEPDYLSGLPSELLRYLTRFLDAFSLCNLAVTSKLLRQICCSILEERGMVIQQWEKQRGHWQVAYRVWHFSTAFTPIRKWGFDDFPSMAVHLSKCPYNVKHTQTDPVRVMIKLPQPVIPTADESLEVKRSQEDLTEGSG